MNERRPKYIVVSIIGAANRLLSIDITDIFLKKYITTGNVNRVHVIVGRRLS